MFCIKRTYNRHGDHDYLTATDPQWITTCAGFRSTDIIQYPDQAEAEKVMNGFTADYAAKFPDCDHKFEVAAFPPGTKDPEPEEWDWENDFNYVGSRHHY